MYVYRRHEGWDGLVCGVGVDRDDFFFSFFSGIGPGLAVEQEKIMSPSGSRKFPSQLTDKPDSVGFCMLISLLGVNN